MEMSFRDLSPLDKNYISLRYQDFREGSGDMKTIQEEIAEKYGVTTRTVRNWARNLSLNTIASNIEDPFKILVYDIETSRVPAMVFQTGKTYITHKQLRDEFKIISISYKWLGQDEVYSLTWDNNHSDEKLMRDFLKVYNVADMVVGYNNDRYDNKWINTRAAKYRLDVNLHVKSFDIYKQVKSLLYLPSYSMEYVAKYFGVTLKQSHEGIIMWDMVQFGTKEEQGEYLDKMVTYNIGDIITTEEIYLEMRKYMGHKVHLGVILGENKLSCPNCGSKDVREFNNNLIVSQAGTVHRHLYCREDNTQFKLLNSIYLKLKESEQ